MASFPTSITFLLSVWQVVAAYITKKKTVLEPIQTTASSLVFFLFMIHPLAGDCDEKYRGTKKKQE
jgi:hypothetical protein